jgi:hypothetical protein
VNQLANKLVTELTDTVFEEVCEQGLSVLKVPSCTFDEADYALSNRLFMLYVQWGQFSSAALVLGGLNLESTVRKYSDKEKTDIYIKCAGQFCVFGDGFGITRL